MSVRWEEDTDRNQWYLIMRMNEVDHQIGILFLQQPENMWVGEFADFWIEPVADLQEAKRELVSLTRQMGAVIRNHVKWQQTELEKG
jgi:hypothetical protein